MPLKSGLISFRPCPDGSVSEVGGLAFIEEVALLVQSKLMSMDVALYYFGSDLIRSYHSPRWWEEISGSRTDPFWELFRSFGLRLHKIAVAYGASPNGVAPPKAAAEGAVHRLTVERYRF
jgi:hypothetical protein